AGTIDNSIEATRELADLLTPGEKVYLMADAPPAVPGLIPGEKFPVLQMLVPERPKHIDEASSNQARIVRLAREDAGAMLALTDIAYPGFFRRRTCEMGVYFGIQMQRQLVAMAGERMAIPGCREISGVCTHPAHSGKGYAAILIAHL